MKKVNNLLPLLNLDAVRPRDDADINHVHEESMLWVVGKRESERAGKQQAPGMAGPQPKKP